MLCNSNILCDWQSESKSLVCDASVLIYVGRIVLEMGNDHNRKHNYIYIDQPTSLTYHSHIIMS